MSKPKVILLQERDFGQKINATFEFVIQNFKPLAIALLFIAGPAALLAGVAQGMFQSRLAGLVTDGGNPAGMSALSRYLGFDYLMVIALSIVTYVLSMAATSVFMVLYEQDGSSEHITPGRVWSGITESLGDIIGANVIAMVLMIIGFVCFVIPGIYLAVAFQLIVMVVVREKLSAVDSLRRSRELTKDKWWSTFGLIMIMSMIAGVIAIVFQAPAFVVNMLSMMGVGMDASNLQGLTIFTSVLSIMGSSVIQGLVWVAVGFQYYNLYEKKTGSGLLSEIDHLGRSEWERPSDETDTTLR